jgi:cellulose synthase (UDP-forming)
VTVEPWAAEDRPDTLLRDIVGGQYDERIRALCATFGTFDRPLFFRWGHEMELRTGRYPWSDQD